MSKHLIAMMGLPRSGKSTIARELSKSLGRAPIVNADAIRLALHGQRYQALAEPMVRALKLLMIRSLFLGGNDVVICDETHYSRAARDYVKSTEWGTYFYFINTPPSVCIQRAIDTGQPDLVQVIEGMVARYEPLGDDEVSWLEEGEE